MAETTLITDDYRDYSVKSIDLDSGSVHPANTNLSASWNFSSGSLFYKTPVAVDEVAIKSYVDAVAFGSRDPKDAVRVAASGNIAMTGTLTIDGIALSVGDRVLAFGQTDASANGIYSVSTGAWPRTADADGTPTGEVTQGLYTLAATGTIWGGSGFILTNDDPITLDTDPLNFVQFTALGQVIAGDGLSKTGNQLDVNTGDGITITSDAVTAVAGNGIVVNGTGINVGDGNGIIVNANDVEVGAGYGITVLADAVRVDETIVPDKTGSNTFSGDNIFTGGLTGSLQQVTVGQSYLVEGTNISIVSQSNGSIVISAIAQQDTDWVDNGNNLSTTSSLNVENSAFFVGPVTSSLGFSGSLTQLANGDSYLIEGNGINIASSSNGSITISVDPAVLDDGDWTDNGNNLSTTSSLNVENAAFFQGPVTSSLGFSGSLTQLANGDSYLIEGQGINIVSSSNGSITIAVDNSVLDDGDWTDNGGNLSTTSSLNVENQAFFQGPVTSSLGFSGSLTQLANGDSYLIEGNAINIVSSSNGSITISVDPAALDDGDWTDNGNNLSTTSSLNVENQAFFQGPVTSSLGFSGSLTQLANGDSYLIEGNAINITSSSNGSIVIAVDPAALNDGDWQDNGGNLSTTSSLNVENSAFFQGPVTSSLGFSGSLTQLANGDSYLIQSGGILITSASNGSVTIGLDSGSIVTLDRFVWGERATGFPSNVFTTSGPFASGTLRVYRRGLRLTEGPTEDYVINSNQQITLAQFAFAPSNLQFDYVKAN